MEREKKTKAIEMTTGSIWKNLFFLSCPLVFSQVLEVLFNMSDVAVVGRFSDYRALGSRLPTKIPEVPRTSILAF